ARLVVLLHALAGCGPAVIPPPTGPGPAQVPSSESFAAAPAPLPPVPLVEGSLAIAVVYPAPTDLVSARDSTFIFGSAGTGTATLTVNGQPVEVWPNGAWLAWLAIPADSDLVFSIEARTATDSARLDYPVRRPRRFVAPDSGVWIDTLSFSPAGPAWWPGRELLPVRLRAVAGAEVRLRLPDGTLVPLGAQPGPEEMPAGIRAFDRDTANLLGAPGSRGARYLGALPAESFGEAPGPMVGAPPGDSAVPCAAIEKQCLVVPPERIEVQAILGSDTARAWWDFRMAPLAAPVPVVLNDDPLGKGDTDSLTVGRARPGATYHWFFPTGTRTVATGRLGDDLRLRLSEGQEVWVPAADAVALPAGTPAIRATVGSLTATPREGWVTLRIPISARVPFRMEEERNRLTVRLYGALGDVDWIRYGAPDPWLREIRWLQAASDEVTISIDLAGGLWGYRARWQGSDLVLDLRRPPRVDAARPFAGRRIVVDPGHPPAGARGPTGLREAEANLAIALVLRDLLAAEGADVRLTRDADTALDLNPRTRFADTLNAELLVSIHNNALPDGVNPFTNNGSSVFYNHPRSEPLARAIQEAFVRELPVQGLGVARGDLALVRPTWMPAVLTEGLFMMLPDQEAALRTAEGQHRYARAVRDGIRAYLAAVAAPGRSDVP
ncbi:MAG: N-acetylmuramoyl-L-alanine amidase, partial [Gemmatimonadota bacterium]|nr:N-acetylmuramoyl-L-alanine amidase [Gemmatimonadota bacterium]